MRYLFLGMLLIILFSGIALAASPNYITVQGKLTDSNGDPVSGNQNFVFKIYKVGGGSALWTESQTINVQNGIFNAILGSVTALELPFDEQYDLEITVNNNILSPRVKITKSGATIGAGNFTTSGPARFLGAELWNFFITGKTQYGDTIGIGGDNTANDVEIRINSPAARNTLAIWNSLLNELTNLRVKNLNTTENITVGESGGAKRILVWNGTQYKKVLVEGEGGGGGQDVYVNETGDTMTGTLRIVSGVLNLSAGTLYLGTRLVAGIIRSDYGDVQFLNSSGSAQGAKFGRIGIDNNYGNAENQLDNLGMSSLWVAGNAKINSILNASELNVLFDIRERSQLLSERYFKRSYTFIDDSYSNGDCPEGNYCGKYSNCPAYSNLIGVNCWLNPSPALYWGDPSDGDAVKCYVANITTAWIGCGEITHGGLDSGECAVNARLACSNTY